MHTGAHVCACTSALTHASMHDRTDARPPACASAFEYTNACTTHPRTHAHMHARTRTVERESRCGLACFECFGSYGPDLRPINNSQTWPCMFVRACFHSKGREPVSPPHDVFPGAQTPCERATAQICRRASTKLADWQAGGRMSACSACIYVCTYTHGAQMCASRCVRVWIDGGMGSRRDGRPGGQMGPWVDGWMGAHSCMHSCVRVLHVCIHTQVSECVYRCMLGCVLRTYGLQLAGAFQVP